MTYRLHDGLQTGGVVVRAALAEIGAPHDVFLTDVRKGDHLSGTYSALNPRQQVPTLIFPDGQIMTESSAILVHLADRHPEAGLLPPPGSAPRGQALRWLAFCATNLYEGENRKLHPERYTIGEPDGVGTAARDFIDRNYLVLETALSNDPFLLGEVMSVTDLYIWMLAQWHHDFEWLDRHCGKVVRCVRNVMERPDVARVHDEQFGPGLGLKPLPPTH